MKPHFPLTKESIHEEKHCENISNCQTFTFKRI